MTVDNIGNFKTEVNAFALGEVSSEEFNPVMWLCEGL